jgi:uncharacterized membrane protein YfcA
MDGHTATELIQLAAAVIAAGIVAGLLAGLFGIGGGAVLVPVLYQALTFLNVPDSVRMHVSVGTSIAIIVPTGIRSFLAHRRRGAVDMAVLRGWIVWVPAGAIVATFVAAIVSGAALRGIFAVVALAVAIRLIANRDSWRIGDTLPANPTRAAVGFFIGLLSTLMGIGGGILNNTFMTLYGRPIHQAVATSAGVGVLISIPGVFGYTWAGWGDPGLPPFSLGFVNIPAMLLIIPTSVLAAPLGVRLAHRLSRRQLEIAFGLFLLFVSARFAVTLL